MKKIKFVFEKMMWHISGIGTTVFMLILAIAAFLAGRINLSFQIAAGIFAVYLITFPLKWFFFRERPKKEKHSNWIERFDASSFPSAHANRAALLFVVLSYFFSSIHMALFLFAMSIMVSYARIYLQRHYWRDIAFGYLLGIAEGFLIAKFIVLF